MSFLQRLEQRRFIAFDPLGLCVEPLCELIHEGDFNAGWLMILHVGPRWVLCNSNADGAIAHMIECSFGVAGEVAGGEGEGATTEKQALRCAQGDEREVQIPRLRSE